MKKKPKRVAKSEPILLDDIIRARCTAEEKEAFVETCDDGSRDYSRVLRRLMELYVQDPSIIDK